MLKAGHSGRGEECDRERKILPARTRIHSSGGAFGERGPDKWLGKRWSGSAEELAVVNTDLKLVKDWSAKNNRPVTIGEFGPIVFADKQSRVTWTKSVRKKFETNGFSWCYFDFGALFKAYDIEKHDWLPGFKEALVGN